MSKRNINVVVTAAKRGQKVHIDTLNVDSRTGTVTDGDGNPTPRPARRQWVTRNVWEDGRIVGQTTTREWVS